MKNQDCMFKGLCREVLAWLVLTGAIVLFGMTVTFAQDSRNKNADGKIHLLIEKEENGRKVKVDMTFDLSNIVKLEESKRNLDEESGLPFISRTQAMAGLQ